MTTEHTVDYSFFANQVVGEMESMGFRPPARPGEHMGPDFIIAGDGSRCEWPSDLDQVHDCELSRWMGGLSAWVAYAHGQLGVSEAVAAKVGPRARRLRAKVMATHSGKLNERREAGDSDPGVVGLLTVEEDARVRTIYIGGILAGYKQRYGAISREVERRKMSMKRMM